MTKGTTTTTKITTNKKQFRQTLDLVATRTLQVWARKLVTKNLQRIITINNIIELQKL